VGARKERLGRFYGLRRELTGRLSNRGEAYGPRRELGGFYGQERGLARRRGPK
jgi:hypothetical protein